ncbi:MAG: LolA-related protein [Acidiferrobacterales bacterium]
MSRHAVGTEGADNGQPWNLGQLMAERGRVSHARARFTEERHSSMLKAPLILSGTLRYDAPSRVEKHTQSPFEERYVVDEDTLLIERHKKRPRRVSLRNHPALWAFVESFRATLSGDVETLQRFYDARLQGNRTHWRLVLVPLHEEMSKIVESIQIDGAQTQITHIEIREVGGDSSRMSIHPDRS